MLGGLGTALVLSVVLAPIGLSLVHRARRHRLAAEGTVTRRADGVTPHPLETLRAFLSLDHGPGQEGEFRRGAAVRGRVEAGRR